MLIWERRTYMFLQESWFRHFNYYISPKSKECVNKQHHSIVQSIPIQIHSRIDLLYWFNPIFNLWQIYVYIDTLNPLPPPTPKSLKFGKQSQDLGLLHKYCTLKGIWVLIGILPLFKNPNPPAPVACNTCPKPEVILVSVKRITNRDLVVDYPSY